MTRQFGSVVLGVAICAGVLGCESSPKPVYREPVLIGALVMPPAARDGAVDPSGWRIDPGTWEFVRNDPLMNHRPATAAFELEWSEIRTRDRLRTDNGRPREYSTTSIRTIQRRLRN